MLEGHRAAVDPDAEQPLLLAHRRDILRPLQRDDDVVLADGHQQLVGIIDRAEDGEIGAGEIGGDGDLGGRDPDLQPFALLDGIAEHRHLRRRRQGGEQQGEEGGQQAAHQFMPPTTTE